MPAWPRITCPACRRSVAVSPDTRHLARHDPPGPQNRRHGLPPISCIASGRLIPAGSDLLLPLWVDTAPAAAGEKLALF
ncbi:hypothetical protein [Streptomyces katrae]|uniref:Uncharacterized protein n=1 Tax=Streptomyces katrae TaxID=68223 RepID=A0A0F4JSG0_9ACTN|nr:hypothetical protein [Streptomyces katrae]KJY37105.1 hypothetical protein VR44_06575 [Streptomyces katrae]